MNGVDRTEVRKALGPLEGSPPRDLALHHEDDLFMLWKSLRLRRLSSSFPSSVEENSHPESVKAKLRDEPLNGEAFHRLDEAVVAIEQ